MVCLSGHRSPLWHARSHESGKGAQLVCLCLFASAASRSEGCSGANRSGLWCVLPKPQALFITHMLDILQELLPQVTSFLSGIENSQITERELVDALRACNYDVDTAVSSLLAKEEHRCMSTTLPCFPCSHTQQLPGSKTCLNWKKKPRTQVHSHL